MVFRAVGGGSVGWSVYLSLVGVGEAGKGERASSQVSVNNTKETWSAKKTSLRCHFFYFLGWH
jgi:hypothetical protein